MSEANDDSVAATVKQMAALTMVSNQLTDIQQKNMKMFPLIFFEGVKEAKVDFDLSRRHDVEVDKENNLTVKAPLRNNFVAYYLTLDEKAQGENVDRRFKALEVSVRSLFWKDLVVEVYFNDKIMYKSVKNGK